VIAMRLEELNALDAEAATRELLRCCGSSRWAQRMADSRPFASLETMGAVADSCWEALDRADWLEAFAAHPKIGAGPSPRSAPPSRRRRFGEPRRSSRESHASGGGKASAEREADGSWSGQEQARVADAADATLLRLADANRDYEARFGYIFIVCATGKSAAGMLDMLEGRIGNEPETEIRIAANEQRKITRLRLMKLVDGRQDTNQ
jgi:OHCU decarboxylase